MQNSDEEYVLDGIFRVKKSEYEKRKAEEARKQAAEEERKRQVADRLRAPPDPAAVFNIPMGAILTHTYNSTEDTGGMFLHSDYNAVNLFKYLCQADGLMRRAIFMTLLEAQLAEAVYLGQVIMSRTISSEDADTDETAKLYAMKLRMNSEVRAIIQAHGKLTSLPLPSRSTQIKVEYGTSDVSGKSGGEPPPEPAQKKGDGLAH